MRREIFVFGANEAGRHGAGAARFAVNHHGAIYGKGYGLQGNSFGIPTKDGSLHTLSLGDISRYTSMFLEFARQNEQMLFLLTPIGTGLAGYTKEDILGILHAEELPTNVVLTREWIRDY